MVLGSTAFSTGITGSVLWGACLLVLLAFYCRLAKGSQHRATLTTKDFGIADAICTGVLSLWMITIILHGFDTPPHITLEVIRDNSILYGALILGIFGVIGFQRHSAVEFFQLQPSRFPKAAVLGLLWLLATYPLILAVQITVQQFCPSSDDSQLIVRYFLEHPDLRHRAAVIFMAVIVAPVAEEVIFRGYFYGVIRRYGGRIPAILISSLLFAAIHIHLPSIPGLFLLAVILCLLYERSGSLWSNITLHAAFNAATIGSLIVWPELAS